MRLTAAAHYYLLNYAIVQWPVRSISEDNNLDRIVSCSRGRRHVSWSCCVPTTYVRVRDELQTNIRSGPPWHADANTRRDEPKPRASCAACYFIWLPHGARTFRHTKLAVKSTLKIDGRTAKFLRNVVTWQLQMKHNYSYDHTEVTRLECLKRIWVSNNKLLVYLHSTTKVKRRSKVLRELTNVEVAHTLEYFVLQKVMRAR